MRVCVAASIRKEGEGRGRSSFRLMAMTSWRAWAYESYPKYDLVLNCMTDAYYYCIVLSAFVASECVVACAAVGLCGSAAVTVSLPLTIYSQPLSLFISCGSSCGNTWVFPTR
jgi:hypothetical protein